MEKLKRALQFLVDESYGTWGGVGVELRDAVDGFNELTTVGMVTIPEDAD